jgi:hypothetical protein
LALNILHQTIKAITAHITAQSAKQNTLKWQVQRILQGNNAAVT